MKVKHLLAASSFILALGMAQSASAVVYPAATTFRFDPTGLGGGSVYDTIDQSPGNALAVGGLTAIANFQANETNGNNALPIDFNLLYQANLSSLQLGGIPTFINGAPNGGQFGNFYTFTLALHEQVLSVGNNNSATFGLAPGGTSIFEIYQQNVPGNNLNGDNFGSATPGGKLIFKADVIESVSSSFTNSGTTANLDGFQAQNWPGVTTNQGTGSTNLVLGNITTLAGFFPELNPASALNFSFFNTSQITPFNQVDPSQCFNWSGIGNTTGINGCAAGKTGSDIGLVNGFIGTGGSPDFLFQADGNQSLAVVGVPEPETLLLLGLGLAAFTLARKRAQA